MCMTYDYREITLGFMSRNLTRDKVPNKSSLEVS